MYQELDAQLKSLLGDERDFIANSANTSSLIYNTLPDLDKSPTRQSRRVFCPGRTNMYLCHSFDTWRRNNAPSSSLLTQYLGFPLASKLDGAVSKVIKKRKKAAEKGEGEDKKGNVNAALDMHSGSRLDDK